MDKTEDNGLYVLTSTKGIETAMKDLDDAIKKHNFSTLQVYDLKKKLSDKGFPLPSECRVVELCNPKQAAAVLSTQMLVSTALPCRISVFEEGGKVKLATILPSKMLSAYFGGQDETSTKALMETASDVQRVIVMIMKEAAGG